MVRETHTDNGSCATHSLSLFNFKHYFTLSTKTYTKTNDIPINKTRRKDEEKKTMMWTILCINALTIDSTNKTRMRKKERKNTYEKL